MFLVGNLAWIGIWFEIGAHCRHLNMISGAYYGGYAVIRIEIEPVWHFAKGSDSQSMQAMLDFLNEIRVTGKITVAAERAHMSYRHAWNSIEKWSAFFEAPLVERRQGHGTTLTPFGDK